MQNSQKMYQMLIGCIFPQPHLGKKSRWRNVFSHNEYLLCWAIVTSLVQLIQSAKKVINNDGKTEVLSTF